MTLAELRLLRTVCDYAKVAAMLRNAEDEALKGIVSAIIIVEREIKLKTHDPITGKCSECGYVDSHTKECSQGRD